MKKEKYVFAGNRAFVLQRMLELGLNVCRIWAVKGSYLERYLDEHAFEYEIIEGREQFLKAIQTTNFDFFVSNGLPVVLPKEILGDENKKFINIHPSLLPDLRGKDPVPGALFYRRNAGTTCHVMNKGIDSGDIIAQVHIPYTDDLDAGLLYQLSFMAEADVFEEAYKKNFLPTRKQTLRDTDIYYSYKPTDMEIDLGRDTFEVISSKVKAFSTGNKGARLHIENMDFVCSDIKNLYNAYVKKQYEEAPWGKVLLRYENRIVVKNIYNELMNITINIGGGGK